MNVPPHHFDDDYTDPEPGGLLGELERRQDDVLSQLDDLDAKLSEVLKGLDSQPSDHSGLASPPAETEATEDPLGDFTDDLPAEDWA